MKADDDHSVIINIPKSKRSAKYTKKPLNNMYVQSILKHTKEKPTENLSDMLVKKYSVNNEKPIPATTFQRDELLLSLKMFTNMTNNSKKKKKLTINITNKYKVKKIDLQKRLFVKAVPYEVKAMTDIDEDFFRCINGRPIRDRTPLFKSLISSLNQLERIKHEIGYRNDCILNIDTYHKNEQQTLEISNRRCLDQAKYFDAFISEDYRKSMTFLKKWDKLKLSLHLKNIELNYLAAKQLSLSSSIMGLDYHYTLQQKYGRFLYYLSPPSWRLKNRDFAQSIELEAKGFDLGVSNIQDSFDVVYENIKNECGDKLIKPVLYFTHPSDLMTIFGSIEMQQLHILAHVTRFGPHNKIVKDGIKYLKHILRQESASVTEMIQRLKKLLEFTKERCNQLKSRFFSILNGLFFESVGAPEVLNLYVHLDYCFERVYRDKSINMDLVTIAKNLELMYLHYSMRLDELHSKAIKLAVSKYEETERRKYKRAKDAAMEIRLFDRLEKALYRTYFPDSDKCKEKSILPPIITSKKVATNLGFKPKSNKKLQKPLSDTEFEYLSLFTNWVEGENPDIYLHRGDDKKV